MNNKKYEPEIKTVNSYMLQVTVISPIFINQMMLFRNLYTEHTLYGYFKFFNF
jgi:hypothetical protein